MVRNVISSRRDAAVGQAAQEAGVQRVQVRVSLDGIGLREHVLEVLPDVKILAPKGILADARRQRNAKHAVQVGRVVVDVKDVCEAPLRLRRKVAYRVLAVL